MPRIYIQKQIIYVDCVEKSGKKLKKFNLGGGISDIFPPKKNTLSIQDYFNADSYKFHKQGGYL
jgi:hypothetical protein